MSDTMLKFRRRLGVPGAVLLASLVFAGCASDAPLDTLKPKSEVADDIFDLVVPVFIVAAIVGLGVGGVIIWLSLKNRVKDYEDDDEFPEQIHGNNTLEITWTIVPAVILAVIAVLTLTTHIAINSDKVSAMEISVDGETTEWDPTVVVVGQQWWWEYRYYLTEDIQPSDLETPWDLPPADIVTSGQFAIPTGHEVDLIVTSRDVIHSHWIPALNGKRDAVPGRFSPWKIGADEPGIYFGQCTEFCGLSHSRMRMQTVAMPEAEFQAWLDMQMAPAEFDGDLAAYVEEFRAEGGATIDDPDAASAALRGLDVFANQCTSCHLVNGLNEDVYDGAEVVSGSAPNLTHLASNTTFAGAILDLYNPDFTWNRDDLSEWIRDPEAVKANAASDVPAGELPRGMPDLNLTERQISDVVTFLETLGPRPTDELITATDNLEQSAEVE